VWDHVPPVSRSTVSNWIDDRQEIRPAYEDLDVKVNELLYRRADLEDVVAAHRLALERAARRTARRANANRL
jgi:hypothetical protein